MRPARELLQPGLTLADGAMGTYLAQLGSDSADCEWANLKDPEKVRLIHQAYFDAGARLLRTNTFAAASLAGTLHASELKALVDAGFTLADCIAGHDAYVAADIGPAYDLEPAESLSATRQVVETFLDRSADLYLFETFADPDEFLPLCRLIRQEAPHAVIAASFAVSPDGLTRKGLSITTVAAIMENSPDIDLWGLNCSIGPTHLREWAGRLGQTGKPLTLMPNSGYPRLENHRLIYGSEPDYFARVLAGLATGRVRLLGGCCGTTPRHIAALCDSLARSASHVSASGSSATGLASPPDPPSPSVPAFISGPAPAGRTRQEGARQTGLKGFQTSGQESLQSEITGLTWSMPTVRDRADQDYDRVSIPGSLTRPDMTDRPARLSDQLDRGNLIWVCELDPPRDGETGPLLQAANTLKQAGIHAITLADAPMARVRMDPVISAARIWRDTGLATLPHLSCRDRNANALRASLLGLYSEGIRQVLAITGDAIPESDRGFVKPVFNVNSLGLLQMIRQLNQDVFTLDPLLAAAAVDPGVINQTAEYDRACRKASDGAGLFLTQPVFDERALHLVRRLRETGHKVLVGIMPLVSWRNAQYLAQEVPGIRIPDTVLSLFHPDQSREDAAQTGLGIARELIRTAWQDADGFYLVAPFNRAALIADLLNSCRLQPEKPLAGARLCPDCHTLTGALP